MSIHKNNIDTNIKKVFDYNSDIENLCNLSFFSILDKQIVYDFDKIYKAMDQCFNYFNTTTNIDKNENNKNNKSLYEILNSKCRIFFRQTQSIYKYSYKESCDIYKEIINKKLSYIVFISGYRSTDNNTETGPMPFHSK